MKNKSSSLPELQRLLEPFSAPCPAVSALLCFVAMSQTMLGYVIMLNADFIWFIPGAVIAGSGLWGCWTMGHDCLHGACFPSSRANEVIGNIILLPTFFPYYTTKYLHLKHHRYLNNVNKDSAWNPWPSSRFSQEKLLTRLIYRLMRTTLWWLGPLFFLLSQHYRMSNTAQENRLKFVVTSGLSWVVMMSVWIIVFSYYPASKTAASIVASFSAFSAIFSVLTLMQHTNPNLHTNNKWYSGTTTGARNPLSHTIDYHIPFVWTWVFWRGNIHSPHHVLPSIPIQNIKAAQERLSKSGHYLNIKKSFDVADLKTTLNQAHIFCEDLRQVVSFDELKRQS